MTEWVHEKRWRSDTEHGGGNRLVRRRTEVKNVRPMEQSMRAATLDKTGSHRMVGEDMRVAE